jgi:dihydrofolate reductase
VGACNDSNNKDVLMGAHNKTVSLISAVDSNMAIGVRGEIPWIGKMKADMRYFVKRTMGKPVIMGRKTFDSIGGHLKGRQCIVLSTNKQFQHEGVLVAHTVEDALSLANGDDIMVIGGGDIYRLFVGVADRVFLTHIETAITDADAFFPDLGKSEWVVADVVVGCVDVDNIYEHSFVTYERS